MHNGQRRDNMDFNVNKEQLSCCETVPQGSAEYSVDCDITLPEYLPDIMRILRCLILPGVQSHQINGDRISADCTCVVRIIYVCEQGKVHSFEQNLSFSKQLELKSADATDIFVGARTDYVNYRVSGQRRFEIHGAITVFARANIKKQWDFITSAQGGGITARCEKAENCNLVSSIEKLFTVSETIDPATTQQISGIISTSATPIIDEIKVISNKLFLKAELIIHTCFIEGDNCEIQNFENIIGVNQIIEVPQLDDKCDVDALLSVLCIDVKTRFDSSTNKNLLDISAVLNFSACGYITQSITVIKDAYSTKYEAELKKVDISLINLEEKIEDTFLCRGSCDLSTTGFNKIHSFVCNDIVADFSKAEDGILINGEVTADIIFEDGKGEIAFAQRKMPFEYKRQIKTEKSHLFCQPDCVVSASNFVINETGKLDVRFEVNIHGFVFSQEERFITTDIAIDETKVKTVKSASLTVYFAEKNESLWSIAEKYNTTTEAIIRENGLTEDAIDKNCRLLIPKM